MNEKDSIMKTLKSQINVLKDKNEKLEAYIEDMREFSVKPLETQIVELKQQIKDSAVSFSLKFIGERQSPFKRKVDVIKAIRYATNMRLVETKELVEGLISFKGTNFYIKSQGEFVLISVNKVRELVKRLGELDFHVIADISL